MSQAITVDYDRIYAEYLRSLVDTLRGFSTGIPGLELWVPHEEPLASLRYLCDAAAASGTRELTVRFGPATRAALDPADLRAVAERYGQARVLATETELVLSIANLTLPASTEATPDSAPAARAAATRRMRAATVAAAAPAARLDLYQAALAEGARPEAAAGAGSESEESGVAVTGESEGVALHLTVTEDHVIRKAGFSAPAGDPRRPLLNHFCAIIKSLPILEAAYHGPLRLEAALRAPGRARPVAGIVLPKAAHPMFALPVALIRAALADYRGRTGFREIESRYDQPLTPAWQAARPAERMARVAAVLAGATDPLAQATAVVAIEHDVRIVLALPEAAAERPGLLLALERLIQTEIDPRLEVFAEERKDRNKLRRLAVVEGNTR
jgi:hypothetical protein